MSATHTSNKTERVKLVPIFLASNKANQVTHNTSTPTRHRNQRGNAFQRAKPWRSIQ